MSRKPNSNPSRVICITLPPDEYAEFCAAADDDQRPLAQFVRLRAIEGLAHRTKRSKSGGNKVVEQVDSGSG